MNPLEKIAYISIPEGFSKSVGSFIIDPSILLPIEIPEDQVNTIHENISWEMIIAAMLKVLAWDTSHKDTEYFRKFILAIRPGIELELNQAAQSKIGTHEWAIAEEIYRALVGLSPANPHHVLNLALTLDQRAQSFNHLQKTELSDEYNDHALQWFRNALSMDEVLSEAYLYAGFFYLRVHEPGRALDLFQSFLDLTPEHEARTQVIEIMDELDKKQGDDNLFKEAFDFIRMGKEAEGISKIDQFLKSFPDVWNAHFLKGWALRRTGKYEDGILSFRKAIENGGLNSDSLNELAICLMETEKFKEAKKALFEALNLEPENVKIISNLGILSLKEGNIEEARGYFATVLEIEPSDSIAQSYLNKI